MDTSKLKPWMVPVATNLPVLLSASAFMPPDAAALTMKSQLESGGLWDDFVADVKSTSLAANEEDATAFVERSATALNLKKRATGDVYEWALGTLEEAAFLALDDGEDEEKEPGPEQSA